jgi:hypothetical protein
MESPACCDGWVLASAATSSTTGTLGVEVVPEEAASFDVPPEGGPWLLGPPELSVDPQPLSSSTATRAVTTPRRSAGDVISWNLFSLGRASFAAPSAAVMSEMVLPPT